MPSHLRYILCAIAALSCYGKSGRGNVQLWFADHDLFLCLNRIPVSCIFLQLICNPVELSIITDEIELGGFHLVEEPHGVIFGRGCGK